MEKIRRNGRRLVEEKYAWEKGVEVLEGILEQMMTKPPVTPNKNWADKVSNTPYPISKKEIR